MLEKNYLYTFLENLSKKLGFADFGVAKVQQVSNEMQQNYTNMLQQGNFADLQYLSKNIDKRFNPSLLVEGAKSILVFLVPYSSNKMYLKNSNKIAQYAFGKDYHKVIKDKLFSIMQELKKMDTSFEGRAFTDSAPVLEREWGVKAGLGFIGKNNFLISKKVGIKNFIGVIISNLELPTTLDMYPDRNQLINGKNYCGNCTKCLEACKSKALYQPYKLDAKKCISYLTIENKNLKYQVINREDIPDFNGWCFGCDDCLNACPWNSKNVEGWEEFRCNEEIILSGRREWWENLQEEEFYAIFKDSPILRGGLENIKMAIEWQKIKENGEF